MRVKVNENAARNYVTRCYRHAHPACGRLHRPEWEEILSKVEGRWLEVETAHLFSDQFNTAPIEGVSVLGIRLRVEDVVDIEGDVRPGVVKCDWCFGYDGDGDGACDKCGRSEHLRPLVPKLPGAMIRRHEFVTPLNPGLDRCAHREMLGDPICGSPRWHHVEEYGRAIRARR
jgi:hypothetical protein